MRELPILFSTPMVQALMREKDPKTMTRRLNGLQEINKEPGHWDIKDLGFNPKGKFGALFENKFVRGQIEFAKAPYQPGDLLWVKETIHKPEGFPEVVYYRADYDDFVADELFKKQGDNWTPSILMPKCVARNWREVVNVRVERLQDITVEDVIKEGLEADNDIRNPDTSTHESIKNWNLAWAQHVFRELWDKLNAKGGHNWVSNPWLWVYEFRRVEHDSSN